MYVGHRILDPITTSMIIETLSMLCTKFSRVLVGDPLYKDHWDDIIGYATLVKNRLENKEANTGKSL